MTSNQLLQSLYHQSVRAMPRLDIFYPLTKTWPIPTIDTPPTWDWHQDKTPLALWCQLKGVSKHSFTCSYFFSNWSPLYFNQSHQTRGVLNLPRTHWGKYSSYSSLVQRVGYRRAPFLRRSWLFHIDPLRGGISYLFCYSYTLSHFLPTPYHNF